MNNLSVPTRQVLYGLAILGLLLVMIPYTWRLQAIKDRYDLGEATLGRVDDGSFMLNLALLGGARGIAANALWTHAVELQKVHEWDRLAATVDLITKLQPHFLAIWTFQGWNLSYNVSVEWDAPEDKYVWIKKGIDFLKQGVRKNPQSPDLRWDTGQTYFHKVGFADEAILLRRLFYDDEDDAFRTDPHTGQVYRDNFQVARGWFQEAIATVDSGAGARLATALEAKVDYVDPVVNRKGRPGDLSFRSMPAHAQTRYAAGLEKQSVKDLEATFGERAQNEWAKAHDAWLEFGRYEYPSHNRVLVGGRWVHEPIHIGDINDPRRLARLTDNQRYWTERWSNDMNYRYWTDRSAAEKETQGVLARQLFYEGTKALRTADFPLAVSKYKAGLGLWKDLLDRHPVYRDDMMNRSDTGRLVRRYVRALKQAGEEVPPDLPFADLLKATEADSAPDPFDQMDMIRPSGAVPASAPQ
jgi:hypothetical protein